MEGQIPAVIVIYILQTERLLVYWLWECFLGKKETVVQILSMQMSSGIELDASGSLRMGKIFSLNKLRSNLLNQPLLEKKMPPSPACPHPQGMKFFHRHFQMFFWSLVSPPGWAKDQQEICWEHGWRWTWTWLNMNSKGAQVCFL